MNNGNESHTELAVKDAMLYIEGSIHFDNVVSVWQKGIGLIKSLKEVKINLKGLTHGDSSALALLTAWVREAKTQKKTIVFIHVPDYMQEITKVCGLDGVLPISWEN